MEEEAEDGRMWAVHARRGRRRPVREDMYAACPLSIADDKGIPVSLFAVFDGHGGARAAQFASSRLPLLALQAISAGEPVSSALEQAFLTTDREFSAMSPASPRAPSSTLKSSQSLAQPSRGETDNLKRTPSGSLFASVALKPADVGGLPCSHSLICAKNECLRKDLLARAYSVDVSNISATTSSASSSSSSLLNVRPNLELRRCKTRVDEHLSSVPVRTSHACGTTATVVTIAGNLVVVAHVGDTRAVICRENGAVTRLCEDHIPGRKDELERIESAGGLVVQVRGTSRVNGVLAVSRAIGDLELKELVIARPDITSFFLSGDEEFILVASDGLWDVVSEREGVDIIRNTESNNDRKEDDWEHCAAKALVECAWERGTTDDVCVLVVNLQKHHRVWKELQANDGCTSETVDKGTRKETDVITLESMTPMNGDEGGLITQRRRGSRPW